MSLTQPSELSGAPCVLVNGRRTPWTSGMTVASLVTALGLAGKRIAVERNGEIVPKSRHAEVVLAAGDKLEIVGAVGGG